MQNDDAHELTVAGHHDSQRDQTHPDGDSRWGISNHRGIVVRLWITTNGRMSIAS